MNYYNEIDEYAARWLRNLIAAGHIAPGVVDTRSIEDVKPSDLRGFKQCHFFAGVGVWSLALRRAGVHDDAEIWTGSCPCQPFSAAGKGDGMDDKRHLWPHFEWLIGQCRPPVVLGEQVASRDADPWLDLVHADLEALGYAFGAVAFPSASVGAPHIRDRTYWVAHAGGWRQQAVEQHRALVRAAEGEGRGGHPSTPALERDSIVGGLGHSDSVGTGRDSGAVRGAVASLDGEHRTHDVDASGTARGLADVRGERRRGRERFQAGGLDDGTNARRLQSDDGPLGGDQAGIQRHERPGPTNGLWRDADWLLCRDGKWRPVEPGTFPLAHGAAARVGRLRAYGNAINAYQAQIFIEAIGLADPTNGS